MSRCVPFPPPGYAKNGVSGDALIELIKLKRIKHEEKLEKKREKKRGKKRKEFEKGTVEEEGKLSKDGIENGENSDVTAEHEQATVPAGRSISNSSDETQSGTSMREREVSCHDDASKKGRIIRMRIKMPLQKQKESETAPVDRSCSTSGGMSSVEQKKQKKCEFNAADKPCSTSGGISSSELQKCEVPQPVGDGHGLETSAIAKDHNSISIAEQPSTSGRDGFKDKPVKSGRSASKIAQSSKLPFEILMDKLTLLPFEALLPADEDTEDWLFGSMDKHDRHQSKRLKMTQDEKADAWDEKACQTVWSQAHCLPEPGTYALPYTVIF